jgi:aspartate aminotransferase
MRLASRLDQVEESATLRVSRRTAELRAAGREVLDFGAGEPDFASPGVAVEAAKGALDAGFTKYTVSSGIPELRDAIAERYRRTHDAPWAAADVVVTVGGKAALFELALALFDAGDRVVIPGPCWVSFPDQVRLAGADPLLVGTDSRDGFSLHAEPLLAACDGRTRAVLVNSPCNPTGGVMAAEELERLVAGAAERGLYVVSDETYDHFVYDGARHASAAALARRFPDTVVLVGSFSKTYAMTGWRIGYVAAPAPVIRAVSMVQGHATSNPTSFAMKGAVAAWHDAGPEVETMLAEYQLRRDLVMGLLEAMPGVQCRPPAGAFYVFPRVSDHYGRHGIGGSVDFAERLLEETGVAVVPGVAFGADDHVRISFACARETLEDGLGRMARCLESWLAAPDRSTRNHT